MENSTLIKVTNRSFGTVGYKIEDLGIHRTFQPGEIKNLTFEELLKLSYSLGGMKIIQKYLIIDNPEAVQELLGEVEPEYYYTDKEIEELLANGSYYQLEDCLNFAPGGVIEQIKKIAVDIELNDIRKRELILKKTGFDINSAVMVKHAYDGEEDDTQKEEVKRKAQPISTVKEETPTRKASTYKIITK